jgi:hypothetical protein
VSIVAFVLDGMLVLSSPESYFERALASGRPTERAINLFNIRNAAEAGTGVDSFLNDVEKQAGPIN